MELLAEDEKTLLPSKERHQVFDLEAVGKTLHKDFGAILVILKQEYNYNVFSAHTGHPH